MPLVSCPDCGRQVSTMAEACPQCARPLGGPRTQQAAAEGTGHKLARAALWLCLLIGSGFLVLSLVGFAIWRTQFRRPADAAPGMASATPATAPAAEGAGSFGRYNFTYLNRGNRTVALFLSPKLPRDDSIFLGATKAVIKAAHNEAVIGEPEMVPWTHEGRPINGLRLTGVRHAYVVIPVKEDTGEIHSLVIYQVA